MEMEKMIELIDAVSKSDLTGFKYEEDGIKLHLSKKENTCYVTENVSAPVNMTGTASAGVVSAEMGKTNAEGDQTLGAAAEEAGKGQAVNRAQKAEAGRSAGGCGSGRSSRRKYCRVSAGRNILFSTCRRCRKLRKSRRQSRKRTDTRNRGSHEADE